MHEHLQNGAHDRVRAHASKKMTARLDQMKKDKLDRAAQDSTFAAQRLAELDKEWDIDRAVLIVFAGMGGVALALGLRKNWRWRFPLTAQIGSLLLHSTVGWCPQAAVLRRLGFRTRQEIESERDALLSMTGAGLATSSP
jgi:hypothetical protein